MRLYDDPVEVRRGEIGTFGEGPDQFLWQGRLWKVRSVLAHRVEAAPWRRSASETDSGAGQVVERELWRVEAGRGISISGVFDLVCSGSDGRWQLVGCAD